MYDLNGGDAGPECDFEGGETSGFRSLFEEEDGGVLGRDEPPERLLCRRQESQGLSNEQMQ
jgi:hypothetical protein